jgi:hypothetical protein
MGDFLRFENIREYAIVIFIQVHSSCLSIYLENEVRAVFERYGHNQYKYTHEAQDSFGIDFLGEFHVLMKLLYQYSRIGNLVWKRRWKLTRATNTRGLRLIWRGRTASSKHLSAPVRQTSLDIRRSQNSLNPLSTPIILLDIAGNISIIDKIASVPIDRPRLDNTTRRSASPSIRVTGRSEAGDVGAHQRGQACIAGRFPLEGRGARGLVADAEDVVLRKGDFDEVGCAVELRCPGGDGVEAEAVDGEGGGGPSLGG